MSRSSPILGTQELRLRLNWATDALRVVCGIAAGDAKAVAQAGLDLAEADEDALLAAGNDDAMVSLAQARTTAAPASGVEDAQRVAEAAAWRDYENTPDFWSTRRQIEMIAANAFRAGLAASPKAQGSDVGLRDELSAAYLTGCEDTHTAIQNDPSLALLPVQDAEFGEAADDYAASRTGQKGAGS